MARSTADYAAAPTGHSGATGTLAAALSMCRWTKDGMWRARRHSNVALVGMTAPSSITK